MNDQKIINLLKMQTALQRELKPKIEEFENLVNEIERLVAESERRQPLRKIVEVRVRVLEKISRE